GGARGRWVSAFAGARPGGTVCTFTPHPGLVTVTGAPVAGDRFSFSTGGPAIVRAIPDPSETITEDQAFVLSLDGATDPASIADHAGFTVHRLPERVPLNVLESTEREAVVRTLDAWQRHD